MGDDEQPQEAVIVWAHNWWECVLPSLNGPETTAHCDGCGRDWVRSMEGGWRSVQEGTVQGQ